jgi:Ca2+-binding RTX toxin-like protein
MAVFRIQANDTSSKDVASGHAFNENGPGTLIVDPDAFLISRSTGAGASLDDGFWTVRVNGAIEALGAASNGLEVFGLFTNASTIIVGRGGDISGVASGITAALTLSIVNFGTISGGKSINSIGPTHITNAGLLIGDVICASGNDTFTDFKKVKGVVKNGTVVGLIDLGDGDDHFNGGARAETFRDSPGIETCNFGGGNDTFVAVKVLVNSDGIDSINGGKGVDTYDASGSSATLGINLDKVEHGFLLGAHSAIGADVGGDQIIGFENVIGGSAGDTMFGSSAANALKGGGGADHLYGLGGRDVLEGGTGADTFHFLTLTDSGKAASNRDLITDFSGTADDGDKIDLTAIDANGSVAGDPGFTFIGTDHFNKTRGQLRQSFGDGNTIVSGDVNGDGKADFSIVLTGHLLLSATDFGL